MYEDSLSDLTVLYHVERTQFLLSGLYPTVFTSRIHKAWYYVRTAIVYFLSSVLVVSMVISMLLGVDDLQKLTDILYYLMTQTAYLCKLLNFTVGRSKLVRIEEHLKNPINYKYLAKYGTEHVQQTMRPSNLAAKAFRLSVCSVLLMYGLFPILDSNPDVRLPFAGWYPVNTTVYRTPIYALQMVCVGVSAFTNANMDIFAVYVMSLGVITLKMLKSSLSAVQYGTASSQGLAEEDLKYLVLLHKHSLQYVAMIEDMFSNGIFIQFIASIGVICLTGFQMLVVPVASMQFLLLISYIACMLCQVALYCWYGNEITTESDTIPDACYMSNWYEGSMKSKKTLFLIMERSKRQIKLTAGKFFTLSLATLVLILKSSYSYFAVLQRIYSE